MIHPEHGATHAYSNEELEQLKSIGWKVEHEQEMIALPVVDSAQSLKAALQESMRLDPPPKRKPGRPRKVA